MNKKRSRHRLSKSQISCHLRDAGVTVKAEKGESGCCGPRAELEFLRLCVFIQLTNGNHFGFWTFEGIVSVV